MWLVVLRFLPYIAGVAALSGVTWFIYDSGFDNGVEKTKSSYEKIIKQERERLQEANRIALEEARKNIATLEARLEARRAQIRLLISEAAQDPDASNDAIGSSSVSRINRVGGTTDVDPGPR